MELRQLEYFAAVAEELNFTRASKRLHVVQSAVSAAVKSLERELGAPLFERTSQRVALTEAGAALLPQAHAALDAVRDALDAVDAVRGGLRGQVRFGTMSYVDVVDVPALTGRFHREHPGVTIRLSTSPNGTLGLAEAVRDGHLDLAFVSLPPGTGHGLRLRTLATMPMVLMVPDDHWLAGAGSATLDERLAREPMIDFPAGFGNRLTTEAAFAAAGLEQQVSVEVPDIRSVTGFVRNGLGIAFLPAHLIPEAEGVCTIPVDHPKMTWPFAVATAKHRPLSAAAKALLSLIDEFVTVPQGDD
jgi:DNA-binding transcriptional LysR family regulator